MSSAQDLLKKAQLIPLLIGAAYGIILIGGTIPAIQKELVFLHHIRLPLWPKYETPEYYGLAPQKARNVYLNTPDGETLGAWHVLPHSYYTAYGGFSPEKTFSESEYDEAFNLRPTIIYLHGNAATRAQPHRVRGYSEMSTRLDFNVLAIDYRGFADSTGDPSQEGLLIDARTAWNYVAERIKDSEPEKQIMLVGHSLGTGVVSQLAGSLAEEKIYPRAITLIAPFTNMPDLLSTFWLFGVIPVLSPLKLFPSAQAWFKTHFVYTFNSTEALTHTSSPTLILHAANDPIIPQAHSHALFDSLLIGDGKRTKPIEEMRYPGWGIVRATSVNCVPKIYWEGTGGGHNDIGWTEGTLELMARIAD